MKYISKNVFLSLRQKCLISNDLKAAYDNGEIMSSGLNVRIFTIGIVAPSLKNHKKGRQDIFKFRNSKYVQALIHVVVSLSLFHQGIPNH